MRAAILVAACALATAQTPDPAYSPLARAYAALQAHDYDAAVAGFTRAIEIAPQRASIRKDLAYTYLKIGENDLARDQFHAAMTIDSADLQVAMEYAFLCYESKREAEARRIFDRIRQTGNAEAEQAFQNIDRPLAAAIERWKSALAAGPDNFSAHFELAHLAEERDELPLAAEHFEKAWRLIPDRRTVLVDLGRVWKAIGRTDDSIAALLAASRGGEPRAAEQARELLPDRYPFVAEFRRALALDPRNGELRRELGYLLLRMDREPEAEQEFRTLTETAPDDMLAATQLGFLLYARGDKQAAAPLFDRVLAGPDEDLANRVRAVLHMPQMLDRRAQQAPGSIDAKVMAERSIKAGYMKDALKYLQVAHEDDPGDFEAMLKLGWTYNILHQDPAAARWFELARYSPDPKIAAEGRQAWRNLSGTLKKFRTTFWIYPIYSTRWHDFFSYAQVKTELRNKTRLQPYLSVRFVGDTRVTVGTVTPLYLSESSFIVAGGVRMLPWHGAGAWFEAGSAMDYATGHILPDYRGGLNYAHGIGRSLNSESSGWFADTAVDAVFVSRFGNDFLVYDQSRFGYSMGPAAFRMQLFWNGNLNFDAQRQIWANFFETGPGVRFRAAWMPPSMYVTTSLLRGAYLLNAYGASPATFGDFRSGIWYAFTR
ncbi:MAG: tetratricopeptide repeat protein [Bryobacteraceae bacterium]|jgi:Flp pilus assembly protein TadD